MKYYSTLRPIGLGTFPKPIDNQVIEIVNFDEKNWCEECGKHAYGYIEYEKQLDEKEAFQYDLVKPKMKAKLHQPKKLKKFHEKC